MAVMSEFMADRPSPAVTTIRDIEQYHWQLAESEIQRQAFFSLGHLSLPAAIELACVEHQFAALGNGTVSSIRLPHCPVWQLLRAAKWPSRRRPAKLRNGGIVLVVLPTTSADVWWVRFLQEIQRELGENGFPLSFARALTSAVAEMVDNVWLHSDEQLPGLLAYQVRRRAFAFCVADLGIGVLASLRKNPKHRDLASSMGALQRAIQPGVSGQEDGTGLGFPSLLHALAELWGTVRLRSGEAVMTIDRSSENRKKDYHYLPNLPGLHVSIRCSLDSPRQK